MKPTKLNSMKVSNIVYISYRVDNALSARRSATTVLVGFPTSVSMKGRAGISSSIDGNQREKSGNSGPVLYSLSVPCQWDSISYFPMRVEAFIAI